MTDSTLLQASELTRSFGHVQALKHAALTLRSGEVRALAGANGSGKSTLIKVLSGFHVPEAGARLDVAGQQARFPMHAEDFHWLGIYCVHQDLGLIPELTVADNLIISEVARGRGLRLRRRDLRAAATQALADVGLKVSLDLAVEKLSRSDRALLALARAFSGLQGHLARTGRCGVLVLDEITAFLPRHEVYVLQQVVRQVSQHGHGVIFVSHDLDEVMDSADSVTVLRDGAVVLTADIAQIDHETLIRSMIGRDLAAPGQARERSNASRPPVVEISDLSGGPVQRAQLSVGAGEIVGITGVLGSGFDSIPYLLFGADRATSGQLVMGEHRQQLREQTPGLAFSQGIGLIPGDRRAQGLYMDLELAENIGSLQLSEVCGPSRLINWRRLRRNARSSMQTYGVVADSERSLPEELSGGNQQKVLLARWLPHGQRLLLLHEPVQGVDIGAREAIVAVLKERAAAGVPIICATSDYDLLVALCDRALIMKDGIVAHELVPSAPGTALDKDRLVELCISDSSEVSS